MSITKHERPGVYSAYDASTIVSGRDGEKIIGLAAVNDVGEAGRAVTITSYEQAVATFGSGDEGGMAELIRLALKNGAAAVVAVAIEDETGYESAFETLANVENISIMICGSVDLTVQQLLRDSVCAAATNRRERIAVVGSASGTVEQLVVQAGALNSERVVLVAPPESGGGLRIAAAVAGAIAGERDPAIPLGGAELVGITGLTQNYLDNEHDLLIQGGVTPLECVGGIVSVVRGVTTKTKNGENPDTTWRELGTIRVVDDVIPAVRDALRAKFKRAKNTEQSRSAIRTQVILELESKLTSEIIAGYDNVSVTADESDPTICLVDFSFTVAHGLNQIWVTAHITV